MTSTTLDASTRLFLNQLSFSILHLSEQVASVAEAVNLNAEFHNQHVSSDAAHQPQATKVDLEDITYGSASADQKRALLSSTYGILNGLDITGDAADEYIREVFGTAALIDTRQRVEPTVVLDIETGAGTYSVSRDGATEAFNFPAEDIETNGLVASATSMPDFDALWAELSPDDALPKITLHLTESDDPVGDTFRALAQEAADHVGDTFSARVQEAAEHAGVPVGEVTAQITPIAPDGADIAYTDIPHNETMASILELIDSQTRTIQAAMSDDGVQFKSSRDSTDDIVRDMCKNIMATSSELTGQRSGEPSLLWDIFNGKELTDEELNALFSDITAPQTAPDEPLQVKMPVEVHIACEETLYSTRSTAFDAARSVLQENLKVCAAFMSEDDVNEITDLASLHSLVYPAMQPYTVLTEVANLVHRELQGGGKSFEITDNPTSAEIRSVLITMYLHAIERIDMAVVDFWKRSGDHVAIPPMYLLF